MYEVACVRENERVNASAHQYSVSMVDMSLRLTTLVYGVVRLYREEHAVCLVSACLVGLVVMGEWLGGWVGGWVVVSVIFQTCE